MEVISLMKADNASLLPMPIKGTSYAHQITAFNFACKVFDIAEGGDARSISSRGVAYLMEMG